MRSTTRPAFVSALVLSWLASLPLNAAAPSPALDPEVVRGVAAMARVGSSASPSFAPDGKRLAFVSNLSGLPQVWTVPIEGGWPELVTALDDPVGSVEWSPDGAWLAFSLAPGGGMNEQAYLVRPDGSGLRRLTPGGSENNRLGRFTNDGRLLMMGSNARSGATIDAYLFDLAGGAARAATRSAGLNAYADVSGDGRRAVLSRVVARGDNNLYLVELESGVETLLTPHDGPAAFSGGVFAPDGRTLYLSSNKDSDLTVFARIRLDPSGKPGGIERLAARPDAELQGFALDRAASTAALLWNVGGRNELSFMELASGRVSPGPTLPGELAGGLTFSADGSLLAFVAAGASLPQDIWLLERTSGRLRQLTHSPHAGVDLAALVRPTLERFRAHDGLELSGWLYRPRAGQGPGPLVLSFHGGPESQERPGFRADYQALLAQGIAVFAPNVRGSSGFGKRFVNLDNGALRFDGVRDIKACIDHVVSTGVAHPRRIGIMGGSYGGYMVMAGLTEYPELLAAGANLFGIVNFDTFFKHTEAWMAAVSKSEYGDPDTQADLLRRLSPIHRLERVRAPTLVLHGANDTNVPVVEAEQVVDTLKKQGVPVEYVLFADEGHGWRKAPNRVRSTLAIVSWFMRYLQDAPAR
jgi:dipeptidyl aminopeptidase/acylaminoacyl peptidase